MSKPWDKLIVALDLTSQRKINEVVNSLSPKVGKFKVGLIAYTKFGPKIINWVKEKKAEVFLDFKLFDIPHTMAETAKAFVDLEVWAFTVHLRAGRQSLKVLKEAVLKEAALKKKKVPLIIGITELTSQETCLKNVLNLAKVANKSNLDGVVCSVWEAKRIKDEFGLITITPGIRKDRGRDDQKRTAAVSDALENKVDYFVAGRPIIKAKDYLKAAEDLLNPKNARFAGIFCPKGCR